MKVKAHVLISGRVQGVWFRESTRREAVALGITGWVKNRPDGRVEVLAEGPEDQIRSLVSWCAHGPPFARVVRVHEIPEGWRGEFESFDIVFK